MNNKTYRIPELVWKKAILGSFEAETPLANYDVYINQITKGWTLNVSKKFCLSSPHETEEQAKAAAQTHFEELMAGCLEEVDSE